MPVRSSHQLEQFKDISQPQLLLPFVMAGCRLGEEINPCIH